ncbi:HlyD family efflux transporter periplasmic adaptor subunit [Salegentibacter maritimus]|uniref:HlyD family efflux transporter periplasmic adaptor subunit n=1 Tax=Salegentibacter maritimus TaxID=2794347 RepID=A0ABS0TH84_9FLAO|nr:HlyD family efflux transporter periplasmic adaptor subunit [Salegentibacter maritimus]MBI6119606.1 HlyD family efflux transporter periplasmic adaptor subunit [Salegentibacter maritimus]
MEKPGFDRSKVSPPYFKPGYLIRRGTGYIFIFFVFMLLVSGTISFDQVVKGDLVLTSLNPPVQIKVKRDGKLSAIFKKPKDSVKIGEIVAILDHPASFNDITYLRNILINDSLRISSLDTLIKVYPVNLGLGTSLQQVYNKYLEEYHKLILENKLGENKAIEQGLIKEIDNQAAILNSKKKELQLFKNNLVISTQKLNRHQKLFEKGVISKSNLENIELEFSEKNQQYVLLEQKLIQNYAHLNRAYSDLEILRKSALRNIRLQNAELIFARQDLLNQILQWEDNNVLKSPIAGMVSYNQFWIEHQNVSEGDLVFSIIPFNREKLLGKCMVPIHNSGQIKKGQKVYLKLENFPFREWGMVRAIVNSISEVPSKDNAPSFVVYLEVDNLKTTYGKELNISQELIGTAEIVLNESSLLERIFYQFRHLWTT